MAATAAQRLGLSPTCAPLARTSFPGDGRDTRDEEPDAPVIQITQGDSRDHRPDLNPVRLDWRVAHHAGRPLGRHPRRGNSRAGTDAGQIVPEHLRQWSTTDGPTALVADRALDRDDHRQRLAAPPIPWMTRVPAPGPDAHTARAQVIPATMPPVMAGDRHHEGRSTEGGVPQRWVLRSAARRPPHGQRTVNQQRLTHGEKEVHAVQQRCRGALACAADAPQALVTYAPGVEATCVHASTVRSIRRDGQRGRPRQDAPPAQVTDHLDGTLASRLATRPARVDPPHGFILATTARADVRFPPQVLLASDTGQGPAARGLRCRTEPQLLAASCSRQKPARLRALLMVMPVCRLVSAA
jgi:hypothetical protein